MVELRRYALTAIWAGSCLAAACQSAAEPPMEVRLTKGFGAFRLINHGPAVQLASAVEVERQVDGRWTSTGVSNLYLVPKCMIGVTSKCVTLPAGGPLEPVAWRGNYCYSQCPVPCDLDSPVPAGTYRFVVSTCDRKQHFASPPFEKK